MNSKEFFQKNKDLRNWWASIVDDPRYPEVLLHARSELLETAPEGKELSGARRYEGILSTLAAADETGQAIPGPGLHHFPDSQPERSQIEQKPKTTE